MIKQYLCLFSIQLDDITGNPVNFTAGEIYIGNRSTLEISDNSDIWATVPNCDIFDYYFSEF